MTCNEIKSLLQHYLDSECSGEHSVVIGKHLEECRDCRNHWLMLKKITSLPVSPVDEPSVDLFERIIANIQEENIRAAKTKAAGGRWAHLFSFPKNYGQWRLAATIVLPLLIGSMFYWKYSSVRNEGISYPDNLSIMTTSDGTGSESNVTNPVQPGKINPPKRTEEPLTPEPNVSAHLVQITEGEIEELIQQLGDEEMQKQEMAQEQIIQLGVTVYPFLVQKLEKTSDPEVKTRLVNILFSE
jgi:hypothetical protein